MRLFTAIKSRRSEEIIIKMKLLLLSSQIAVRKQLKKCSDFENRYIMRLLEKKKKNS